MLCLDVAVNDEPYCVAWRRDGLVSAGVSRHVNFDGRRTRALRVLVFGVAQAGFDHFVQGHFLRIGDVVTVRVVEREVADARMPPPELFQHVSDGVEVEVFLWVWLIVGAAMILAFG